MPDDMMAARRSRTGYKGVGVALPAVDQEGPLAAELSAAGWTISSAATRSFAVWSIRAEGVRRG
jgi:hypothetical protein